MNRWFLTFAGLLTFMFIHQAGFADQAQPMERGFYIDGQVDAAIPLDGDLQTDVFFGGRAGYQFNSLFGVDIESGYASFNDDTEIAELSIVPLLINGRLYPFQFGKANLYVFGGLGAIFSDIDIDQDQIDPAIREEFGVSPSAVGISLGLNADTETTFGGQVGIGVIYNFAEHVSAFLEARILFGETDVSGTVTASDGSRTISESFEDEQELHTVFLGGGFRIRI